MKVKIKTEVRNNPEPISKEVVIETLKDTIKNLEKNPSTKLKGVHITISKSTNEEYFYWAD